MQFANLTVAAAIRRAGLDARIPDGEGRRSLPVQFLPGGAGWVGIILHRTGTVRLVCRRVRRDRHPAGHRAQLFPE
ncbi:hypothetical protein [Ottowia thiooxydans]|uniref:DUF4258 domain-containing protein n=1 Tax=Ottowia thiooxydans TaxID=219182 RepID=A0ABV2Q472_9BURK